MISAALARQLIDYSPETGVFKWRARSPVFFKTERDAKAWNTLYAGKVAGTPHDNGYLSIRIFGRLFFAHRLAWVIVHGDLPEHMEVDHINHDRKDTRLANLRLVDHLENQKNLKLAKNNNSGIAGVCWVESQSRWRAQIMVSKRSIFLGNFIKKGEAIAARKAAEVEYGFHKNHGERSANV